MYLTYLKINLKKFYLKKVKFVLMVFFKKTNCIDHTIFSLDKLLTCKIFKKCKDYSKMTGQS